MDNAQIIKNLGTQKTDRSNINGIWDLIDDYVVPFRSDIYNENSDENSNNWRNRTLYDSTAADDCETLSSAIHGSITSMSVKFFSMQFRQEILNEDRLAMEWIQQCEDIVFETLQDSNLDIEASEFYLDLTSYGTSIIVEEIEDEINWKGIDFQSVPIHECYFDQDKKGNIINLYREMKWTANEIIDKFGEDKVPQSIIDKKHTSAKMPVVFCIYKRGDNYDDFTEVAPKQRKYGFKYVLVEGRETLGEEGGYYEMPAFVTRWRKTSRSKWGFSPAFVCMSDILSLNQLVEDTFEALGKVIDPATLTTARGLLSDLDLGRAGLTVVRDVNDIKEYESKARFDVGEMKIDRLQMAIHKAFKIDKLQMKENVQMTAEEFRGRWEMMHRMLGPTAGRIQNDFLDPMIQRTFNILYRAKKLPEMPDIVKEHEGVLNIEYTGPMARAQKRQVAMATQEWLSGIGQMGEVFPEAMDIPNVDLITRDLGTLGGVPVKYMNTADDVKKGREARAESQANVQANEDARLEGEAKKAQGEGNAALEGAGNV